MYWLRWHDRHCKVLPIMLILNRLYAHRAGRRITDQGGPPFPPKLGGHDFRVNKGHQFDMLLIRDMLLVSWDECRNPSRWLFSDQGRSQAKRSGGAAALGKGVRKREGSRPPEIFVYIFYAKFCILVHSYLKMGTCSCENVASEQAVDWCWQFTVGTVLLAPPPPSAQI